MRFGNLSFTLYQQHSDVARHVSVLDWRRDGRRRLLSARIHSFRWLLMRASSSCSRYLPELQHCVDRKLTPCLHSHSRLHAHILSILLSLLFTLTLTLLLTLLLAHTDAITFTHIQAQTCKGTLLLVSTFTFRSNLLTPTLWLNITLWLIRPTCLSLA